VTVNLGGLYRGERSCNAKPRRHVGRITKIKKKRKGNAYGVLVKSSACILQQIYEGGAIPPWRGITIMMVKKFHFFLEGLVRGFLAWEGQLWEVLKFRAGETYRQEEEIKSMTKTRSGGPKPSAWQRRKKWTEKKMNAPSA